MNNIIYVDKFYIWQESDNEKMPDVSFIPPMTRRRMTDLQKIAIGLAKHVMPEDTDYQIVFASRFGEWQQTIKLITQFHNDSEMSPAGFSNSVHNAAPGALSVLTKNKKSYISIAAGTRTLESGILATLTAQKPVLFIFAEEKSPELYNPFLENPVIAHGIAFMVTNSGKRQLVWQPGNYEHKTLTFDAVSDFLIHGGEMVSSCWKMVDK